jgi:hypothetical protein
MPQPRRRDGDVVGRPASDGVRQPLAPVASSRDRRRDSIGASAVHPTHRSRGTRVRSRTGPCRQIDGLGDLGRGFFERQLPFGSGISRRPPDELC